MTRSGPFSWAPTKCVWLTVPSSTNTGRVTDHLRSALNTKVGLYDTQPNWNTGRVTDHLRSALNTKVGLYYTHSQRLPVLLSLSGQPWRPWSRKQDGITRSLQSLISLLASVDVKQHVYLLYPVSNIGTVILFHLIRCVCVFARACADARLYICRCVCVCVSVGGGGGER